MSKTTKQPAARRWYHRLVRRFIGRAYPVRDIKQTQARHGRKGAHIDARWTTPDHFAHNNYERSHHPQLCVIASGWKARLIAAILWPKEPWNPFPLNDE